MKKTLSIILTLTLLLGLYVPTISAATTTSVTPVIHLAFENDLKDSSGNGYNGSAPDANVTYVTGPVGKAARVDSAMITLVGSSAVNLTNAFSFSAWIRLDQEVPSYSILSREATETTDSQLTISSSYDDTGISSWGLFSYKDDSTFSSTQTYYTSTYIQTAQNKDRFMHVAIVYNGTTWKYYLDGKLDNSTTVAAELSGMFFGTGKDFIVGGESSDSFFHGYIDDLYIFDKAITFTDVTSLYGAGVVSAANKMVVKAYDPYMLVNGTKKEIDPGKGTYPIINAQNRTILPIRAIIEEMGGTIAWDGVTKCVTVNYKSNVIKLWINKDKAEVNGVMKEIDPGKGVVPELIKNRTMLPIRFILEELKLPPLVWDSNLQTITIQY